MGVPAPITAAEPSVGTSQDFISEGSRELWFVRGADAAPLGGVGLCLVLTLLLMGITRLIAVLDPSAQGLEARLPYTLSLAIALIVPLAVWALRRAQDDLDSLRSRWLGTPEAFAAVRVALARLPNGVLAAATLAGVLSVCVVQELLFGRFSRISQHGIGLAAIWELGLGMLLWALILSGLALAIRNARVFGRVGTRGIRVALYEAEQGLPLARLGLRTLALWLGIPLVLGSIGTVLGAVDPRVLLVLSAVYAFGATFCLLVPTSGLRGRIRRDKREELARIARALAGEPDAMAGSALGEEARSFDRLRLLQWRREVQGFREWPLDAPVLRRFALFVALPLLSWIASALVERVLDVLLDR